MIGRFLQVGSLAFLKLLIIVVRDFLTRVNIPYCTHFQVIEISGVGIVAVVDIAQLTLDVHSQVFVEPKYMVTIFHGVFTPDDTDDLTGGDELSGKQSLAMDGAFSHINHGV